VPPGSPAAPLGPGDPPAPDARDRTNERRWLLGLLVVTGCSWGRWLATGSLKIDENFPSLPVGLLLFVALMGGLLLLVLGWRGFLERPPARPRRLAFAGLFVAAFMLPMLSNDVFSLFAYASLAARGIDVSTTPAAMPLSPWFPWVGEVWKHTVCVYGPTTLLAVLPSAAGGSNAWLALGLLRLTWFLPIALVMELSFRRLAGRPFFHTMVWLNPLWIIEGPGQLHPDLLGLVAITAGVILQREGRPKAGWACWALAILGKYSFAFTGCWFWLSGARTARQKLLRIPAILAVLGVAAVLFFSLFWHGWDTVLVPIRTLAAQNPGGSLVEVVSQIIDVLRGGSISSPSLPPAEIVALNRASKGDIWAVVSLVVRVVFVVVTFRFVRNLLRRPATDPGREDAIALATGAITVAAVTIASHRFQSWYLLAALPFFGLSCPPVWRRWWVWAAAVAPATTLAQMLPRDTVLIPVWGALATLALMVLFLAFFRGRYFAPDADQGAAGPAPSPTPTVAGLGASGASS